MSRKVLKFFIGNSSVEFISEVYNGEVLDTAVIINGTHFCTIAGNDREKFRSALRELLNYSI